MNRSFESYPRRLLEFMLLFSRSSGGPGIHVANEETISNWEERKR